VVRHSPIASQSSVNGYRPGSVITEGSKALALPDGWKPYVYRGTKFEEPPIKHGTVEGATRHKKEGTRVCHRCRKAVREAEAEKQEQEVAVA